MAFLRKIAGFLVYSNLWIGLGAAAFTWKFYWIMAKPVNYWVIGFVFSSTVLTYTFQRYVKLSDANYGSSNRFDWMNKNPFLVLLILLASGAGAVWTAIYLNRPAYLLLVFLGFCSFFYIIKIPGLRSLRNVPTLKIFVIAFTWAATATLLPHLNGLNKTIDASLILLFIADFLFVLAITIPFDIRDIDLDDKMKMTLPQVLGVRTSLVLACVLLLPQLFIIHNLTGRFSVGLLIPTLIALALVGFSTKKKDDLYFSFLIDGLLILQPLFIYPVVSY